MSSRTPTPAQLQRALDDSGRNFDLVRSDENEQGVRANDSAGAERLTINDEAEHCGLAWEGTCIKTRWGPQHRRPVPAGRPDGEEARLLDDEDDLSPNVDLARANYSIAHSKVFARTRVWPSG
jgi:hypothetical protein